ncbi:MAG: Por secretion system protein [Prevotellaceae bacterium]|nr:Por secretion system protein [Candidatus Colivivens equi]
MGRIKLFLICCFTIFQLSIHAQAWKVYSSFANNTKAVKTSNTLYVISNGSLFSYDTNDNYVQTYDKVSQLSDHGIIDIALYGSNVIILYKNGNIDILGNNDLTYNLTELTTLALNETKIHELRVFGTEATIATDNGLAIYNLKNKTLSTLYNLESPVLSCIIADNIIYAKTSANVCVGTRSKNLQDFSNWQKTTTDAVKPYADFDAFAKNEEDINKANLKIVENIHPDGPIANYFYKMHFDNNNRLLVAGGCFNYPELNRDGTIMMYEKGKWSAFDDKEARDKNEKPGWYMNITDVVECPNDPNLHYAGSSNSGLYKFEGLKCVEHYSYSNSPLKVTSSVSDTDPNKGMYVRTTGLAFDKDNNLWMLNCGNDTILRVLKNDNSWEGFKLTEIADFSTQDHILFDSRNWVWLNNRRTTSKGNFAGVLILDYNNTLGDKTDDKHVFIKTLVNQDGKSYTEKLSEMNCIVEDLNGTIWVGTNQGPFMIEDPTSVFSPDFRYTQVKVPRNDGSDLADYLLNEVAIKCIAIDGGNRKWFGTVSNGVYLTNADGTEIIHHFTKDNSPLISDEIYTIAIDGRTGEVLIGTCDGLCSYMGDATDPVGKFDEDLVKVYPNPIRPEYSGDIKITGLMNDSHVKIVSANGRLVNKGTSIGGSYIWNGRLDNGKAAMPGIYYILATDISGNESVAGKFLIVR